MHTHASRRNDKTYSASDGGIRSRGVAPGRFCDPERLALLRAPGLGPTVVSRLEEQGLTSLDAVRAMGVDRVIDMVCNAVGSPAWKNRHGALARALSSSILEHEPVAAHPSSQPSGTYTAD